MHQLDHELERSTKGIEPTSEHLPRRQLCLIAADGVSVPLCPDADTTKGKNRFREAKIAMLARLK